MSDTFNCVVCPNCKTGHPVGTPCRCSCQQCEEYKAKVREVVEYIRDTSSNVIGMYSTPDIEKVYKMLEEILK